MLTLMLTGKSSSGEDFFVPPDNVFQVQPFSSKLAMEFAHLQHFKRLIKRQHPQLLFKLIGNNPSDPPDFYLSRSDVRFGLELTAFATAKRRERANFISKLHDRLIVEYERGALNGLSGLKVDISFGELGGKPFAIEPDAFEQLVGAFEELGSVMRPIITEEMMVSPGDRGWPKGNVGAIKWQVTLQCPLPLTGSKLANRTGFEVEYTHREWLTESEVLRALNESVLAKDRPVNDELLIVAGGPDLFGRIYPAEGVVLTRLLNQSLDLLQTKPKHLKRVFVDVWGADRVYLIHEVAGDSQSSI